MLNAPWLTRFFGDALSAYDLWHINRRSVSSAFFIGIFFAFIPIPAQMLFAAAAALKWRCNLPLAISLVWISNPITMPAIFYGNYVLGASLLNMDVLKIDGNLNFEEILQYLPSLWLPLSIGSLIVATAAASLSFFVIRGIWRLSVVLKWLERKDPKK